MKRAIFVSTIIKKSLQLQGALPLDPAGGALAGPLDPPAYYSDLFQKIVFIPEIDRRNNRQAFHL